MQIFSITKRQKKVFTLLLAAILVFDLFAQVHYLQGALLRVPSYARLFPWLGLALASLAVVPGKGSRFALALLVLLHYGGTMIDGKLSSQADSWIWLMGLAFVCIPDEGETTTSDWVFALKLIGFCVYFFAGLHKMVNRNWWTGEALMSIFQYDTLVNPNYMFLTKWPLVCQLFCLATLAQRLIVPLGFWSRKTLLRRVSAGVLAIMHYGYIFMLGVGLFSWAGILYLFPLYLVDGKTDRSEEKDYYRAPKKRNYLALAFAACMVAFPAAHYLSELGLMNVYGNFRLPGFGFDWDMFGRVTSVYARVEYSAKTCQGDGVQADELFWDSGASSDYFRRRFMLEHLRAELLSNPDNLGDVERSMIRASRELLFKRNVKIFRVENFQEALALESEKAISPCPSIFQPKVEQPGYAEKYHLAN